MRIRKDTPPPQPAADALAALQAELIKVQSDLTADQAELRRIDLPGGVFQSDASKLGNRARLLLNGAVANLLPPPQPNTAERIATLKDQIKVAETALDMGGRLVQRLQAEVAEERFRLRADDVKAVMVGIVDAVLALEQAFQRRDALLKEIKPPAHRIPAPGWMLLGRVGRSESTAYRFLQQAASAGWISHERLEAAVKLSRKALGQ